MFEGNDRHRRLDPATAKPAARAGVWRAIWSRLCTGWLTLGGWRMEGDWPGVDKAVIIAAPHTSNWDGINMLAAAGHYRIKLSWMGKKSLTTGPFGGLVKWLGCVPVSRGAGQDMVGQMREAFAKADYMVLAIAPEGTRSLADSWKFGYYHVAREAGVPIIMSVLDYGQKRIALSGVIWPGGDIAADYELIRSHYESARGKFPERSVLPETSD